MFLESVTLEYLGFTINTVRKVLNNRLQLVIVMTVVLLLTSLCIICCLNSSVLEHNQLVPSTAVNYLAFKRFMYEESDSSHDSTPNDHSNLNIYFTVKTTPGNYEKRMRPIKLTWFQKVNKQMVSHWLSSITIANGSNLNIQDRDSIGIQIYEL